MKKVVFLLRFKRAANYAPHGWWAKFHGTDVQWVQGPKSEPKSLMGKEMYIATIYAEKLDKEVQWKWDSDEAVWQDPTSSEKAKE